MKMDITVTKKDHVNLGDYSSTEPSVSLTLKDVNVDDFEQAQENLSLLTELIWIQELIAAVNEIGEMVNTRASVLSYVDNMQKYSDLEKLKKQKIQKIQELDKIAI